MGKLTAIAVKNTTVPGRYGDGGGLNLFVRLQTRKDGHVLSRNWIYRYQIKKRTRDLGLGSYPKISLAQARTLADAARELVKKGIDPVEARKEPEPEIQVDRSFRTVAGQLIEERKSGWRNAKHAWQWENGFERHVYPLLGDRSVVSITTEDVLAVLRPIWTKTPETASRIRNRIEAVLDWARASGWRSGDNPARWKGHLSSLLTSPKAIQPVVHQASLPWRQMPAFMVALREHDGFSARALEFAIFTVARTSEVRFVRWKEIDLKSATWTVPAERMKMKRAHRVPLSEAAIAVLKACAPGHAPKPDDLVFPGMKGGAQSAMSMVMLLRRMNGRGSIPAVWKDALTGEPVVPHGFRSTFRIWAAEQTPYAREISEAALAHKAAVGVEAAYQRSDLMDLRRPLMNDWARWCNHSRRPEGQPERLSGVVRTNQ